MGSERPTAHTQQELSQVPAPPSHPGILDFLFILYSYNFRISLIKIGDRIPSHEQIVIQEYIEKVKKNSLIMNYL